MFYSFLCNDPRGLEVDLTLLKTARGEQLPQLPLMFWIINK